MTRRIQARHNHRPQGSYTVSHGTTYRVSTFLNGDITTVDMTTEEIRKLKPNGVDFCLDLVWGENNIRLQSGKSLPHYGDIPGIGDISQALLLDLMWCPGVFMTPAMLAKNKILETFGRRDYGRNAMSSRLRALRHAFGDNGKIQWYFQTRRRRFAVCWNRNRTWRIIEAIPQATEHGNDDGGTQSAIPF